MEGNSKGEHVSKRGFKKRILEKNQVRWYFERVTAIFIEVITKQNKINVLQY